MCSADGTCVDGKDSPEAGPAIDVGDAIHVVGSYDKLVSVLTTAGTRSHAIENKYYTATVPVRTYECLDCVPDQLTGALVVVLERATARSSFNSFSTWWEARKADDVAEHDVDVPLIVVWGMGSVEGLESIQHVGDEGQLRGLFEWSVEEGFELVCVEEGAEREWKATARADTMEAAGLDRILEALQHCRWTMAEMNDSVVSSVTAADSDQTGEGIENPEESAPSWRGMNEDVLRAFERLAACGSDSEDEEGELAFDKLAALLRRTKP